MSQFDVQWVSVGMVDSGCLWTLMSQFDVQWVSVDPYVSV